MFQRSRVEPSDAGGYLRHDRGLYAVELRLLVDCRLGLGEHQVHVQVERGGGEVGG